MGGMVLSRNDVREFRWRYLPRNVRVYNSLYEYVVLWVDRGSRVYAGASRYFSSCDEDLARAEVMELVWRGPMKRKDISAMAGARVHAAPGKLADTHPNLAEFMTAAVFGEDGQLENREAPTLTVWCAGGQWRASAKDRAEGLVLFVAAESWSELFQMLDLFVLEESAPWRHDEGTLPRKKQK